MAQRDSENSKFNTAENLAVSVPNAGLTTLLQMRTNGRNFAFIQITVSVQALAAFQVSGRAHADAPFSVISAAITATPGPLVNFGTGALATQGVGTGATRIDVGGMYEIKVEATGGNATPSVVNAYGTIDA